MTPGFMRCRICHHRPIVFKWHKMWHARCPYGGPRGYRRYRLKRDECLTFCLWTKRGLRREWNWFAQRRWKGTPYA